MVSIRMLTLLGLTDSSRGGGYRGRGQVGGCGRRGDIPHAVPASLLLRVNAFSLGTQGGEGGASLQLWRWDS